MKKTRYIALLLGAFALATVTSCKVGKKYARPEMALPERIDSASTLPDTFSIADMQWWTVYTDTILQNQSASCLSALHPIQETRPPKTYAYDAKTETAYPP